ncbi:hypothetical protein ILYODFUR_018964 [Ilyodon furcidens]|uniref:Uncharacterized protein n=1 Tax=Ilyodon furcidens TaxID=33524 RepID=A0ABV0UT86_9TELE
MKGHGWPETRGRRWLFYEMTVLFTESFEKILQEFNRNYGHTHTEKLAANGLFVRITRAILNLNRTTEGAFVSVQIVCLSFCIYADQHDLRKWGKMQNIHKSVV